MSEITSRLSTALADRYRIERRLGEGGMATVYLAEDLKHDRKVALKVLKAELAAVLGAERFVQEIKTTASLQHPNILPLFDSGEADGFLYYVMPYIEGETLRERLDREAQLGIDEAVKITTEVAEGLDSAHRQNVIHRDIKPENILLHDGRPIVADFGIALAVSAAAGGRMTETGLSLGTPHYMSPEQATAEKDIGHRSDIYSLGSVLYEMLAGEPPHSGGTAQQVIMKIVTEEVQPVAELRRTVPPHIAAATAKALEKLPADRFESAAKFAEALTNPGFAVSPTVVATGTWGPGPWNKLTIALAGVAVGMAIVAGVAIWNSGGSPATTSQPLGAFVHTLPDGLTMARVGSYGPALALSESGTRLAYVAHDGDGATKLYVRQIDEFEARELPGTERAWSPFFSPDEQWVGFMADNKLQKVALDGGTPQTIAAFSLGGSNVGGATWGPDNTIIFADMFRPGLWRVSDRTGTPERISGGMSSEDVDVPLTTLPLWPSMLPDNEHVLYTIGTGTGVNAGIAVISLETGEARLVIEGGGNAHYAPTGHLIYAERGDLLAQPFDLDELSVTGPAVPVLTGVMTGGEGTGHFAMGRTGSLAYVPGRFLGPARQLEWVDLEGNRERLALSPGDYGAVRVSPDGRRLLYNDQESPAGLWIYDIVRGGTQRAGGDQTDASNGMWSLDGQRLVFSSKFQGSESLDLAWIPADGTGQQQGLLRRPLNQYAHSWADSGQTIILSETENPVTLGDVWMLELDGDREVLPLLNTPSNEALPTVSADGQWLAFVSDDNGRQDVFVQPLRGTGRRELISTAGGTGPIWAPDGRELYYRDASGDTVWAVTFQGQPTVEIGIPRILFTGNYVPDYPFGRGYDLAPDGTRFLMTTGTPPVEGWTEIRWVLGWTSSLLDVAQSETTNR